MEQYWDLVKRIIKESDIVLEILDARLVELSRNEEVEKITKEIGRPLVFVINKSDLVSKNRLKNQVKKLREEGEVVFISAKNKNDFKILLYTIRKLFKKFGKRKFIERSIGDPKPEYREAMGDIVVGILGYPNVGKSSIINALAHKKKVKVSKKPGTTHGIHWVRINDEIKLIDSPGVIPLAKDDDLRYGLIGARESEQLRNPEVVADALIKLFIRNNKEAFENFYGIKITVEDSEEIVAQISKKRGYLVRGGLPDENRTYFSIIRDWQQGRLRL